MARRRLRILDSLFGLATIIASIAIGNGLITGSLEPVVFGWLIPGAVLWGWLVVIGGVLAGLRMFGVRALR